MVESSTEIPSDTMKVVKQQSPYPQNGNSFSDIRMAVNQGSFYQHMAISLMTTQSKSIFLKKDKTERGRKCKKEIEA